MHLHWHRMRDETAPYSECRCGHRKRIPIGPGIRGAIVLPVASMRAYEPLSPLDETSIHDEEGAVMEPLEEIPLEKEDLRVLLESLWHSVQRGDVTAPDRDRMLRLREQLKGEYEAFDAH